jgi:hypothetical protein
MYTSGRTVKSRSKRQDVGLTVVKATRQARALVDRVMPGVGATVDSRLSHDLDTDTPTVVTTVTFPRNHAMLPALAAAFGGMGGPYGDTINNALADSSITITRRMK